MKITDKQLENLQGSVQALQTLQSQAGGAFIQAVKIVVQDYFRSEEGLRQLQAILKDEYGDISVNIQTGEYTPVQQEAEEVVGPEVLKKA